MIIELTDNDIELQVFADAFDWQRLEIFDPNERKVFDARARGWLVRQGGMSEMFWASEPSHYLVDEPNFDESVEDFLRRWPEGVYEYEGSTNIGVEIEGETFLSHVLPALPEIVAPVSETEDPPLVDPDEPLVIDWQPVTTRFIGPGTVEIFEYQVILDQTEPERTTPWVDGGTRRALINLPPDVTELTVSPEFLLPGASYEFEILAIEASGNSTISVGEFGPDILTVHVRGDRRSIHCRAHLTTVGAKAAGESESLPRIASASRRRFLAAMPVAQHPAASGPVLGWNAFCSRLRRCPRSKRSTPSSGTTTSCSLSSPSGFSSPSGADSVSTAL